MNCAERWNDTSGLPEARGAPVRHFEPLRSKSASVHPPFVLPDGGQNVSNSPKTVILSASEESSRITACGRAVGSFAALLMNRFGRRSARGRSGFTPRKERFIDRFIRGVKPLLHYTCSCLHHPTFSLVAVSAGTMRWAHIHQ